jgi:hypothetical protein
MPAFPAGASAKGGQAAAKTNRESAREFYAPILPVVAELHGQGLSLRQIARELDRRGVPMRIGYLDQRWNPVQVSRLLARIAAGAAVTQPAGHNAPPSPSTGVTVVGKTQFPASAGGVTQPEKTGVPPEPEVPQSRFHRDQTSEELWKPSDWLAGRLPTG